MSQINDADASRPSFAYTYDALDRLVTSATATRNITWSWDANGNMLTENFSPQATNYQSTHWNYTGTNNRLTYDGAYLATPSYDAAGNITGEVNTSTHITYDANFYDAAGHFNTGWGWPDVDYINALGQSVNEALTGYGYLRDDGGRVLGDYMVGGFWEDYEDYPIADVPNNVYPEQETILSRRSSGSCSDGRVHARQSREFHRLLPHPVLRACGSNRQRQAADEPADQCSSVAMGDGHL